MGLRAQPRPKPTHATQGISTYVLHRNEEGGQPVVRTGGPNSDKAAAMLRYMKPMVLYCQWRMAEAMVRAWKKPGGSCARLGAGHSNDGYSAIDRYDSTPDAVRRLPRKEKWRALPQHSQAGNGNANSNEYHPSSQQFRGGNSTHVP